MKFVEQEVELVDMLMHEHIEYCGRTCYSSTDKIKKGSYKPFIKSIIKRGHESVLEHKYISLGIYDNVFAMNIEALLIHEHKLFKHFDITTPPSIDFVKGFIMTANIRAWRDLLKKNSDTFSSILSFLKDTYPLLFGDIETVNIGNTNIYELSGLDNKPYTFKLQCDIGAYKELTRHRTASFSIESTRWINYNKKGMSFMEHPFYKEKGIKAFLKRRISNYGFRVTEWVYSSLIKLGAKPEQARLNLPHNLKATVIMTAKESDWNYIFSQRIAPDVHPQVLSLMTRVKEIIDDDKCEHELLEILKNQ